MDIQASIKAVKACDFIISITRSTTGPSKIPVIRNPYPFRKERTK